VVRNKTTEEMAKDASKTLAKIRKRKFRLMAGMNDKLPKENALKIMIEELDKKEAYYLSLFFGKEIKETKTINISVLPTEYKKYLLFYFDEKTGLSQDKTQGNPVWLNIEEDQLAINVDLSSKYDKTERLLPYRSPKMVKLSLLQNSKSILQTQLPLAQFGVINYLPLSFLKESKIIINSETGNINILGQEPSNSDKE
jgi:hypothetical protein